ncbi:MAG: tRNA-specific adenosine deaminase [Alteromonadaceae bacterium]|jgi:tRNA(adenine34) deaminase|nr:tRNA-specific adenosine deaminase [Alteromonadaceae bacterium]MBL6824212.1 nucleoside deaminase [Luminiphilus sp.]RCL47951.1 MAG: nucleoside deaminase [Halieaceae bacterium]RPH10073.1 MAG: nucleoside deaminase [Alteromonadaceae bacterium TMED101]MBL6901097.1 nucleoside deaminase [Luminiphilus sp.]
MTIFSESDSRFMALAVEEAGRAASLGEVPVGAVVVRDGQVLALECNRQITLNDPSAHAEMLALRKAAQMLGNYRLPECELFVTLEPCTMCCGALIHARVKRLVFATTEPKAGAVISTIRALDNPSLNHSVLWQQGLMASDSAQLLREFFKTRRASKTERRPSQ